MGGRKVIRREAWRLFRVVDEVADARNLDDYASRAVRALGWLIPTDLAASYSELDLAGNRIIRDVTFPDMGELPRDAENGFWEFNHQHPLAGPRLQEAAKRPIRISDYLSRREFHALELYQRFFRLVGSEHEMLIAFPAPGGQACGLTIDRASEDFSDDERSVLGLLRPHLVRARRAAADRERLAELDRALAADVEIARIGPGGTADFRTARGWTWMAEYFDGHRPLRGTLPAELGDWVTRSGHRAATGDPGPPSELTVRRDGRVLRLRVVPGRGPGQPDLLLLQQSEARRPAVTAAARRLTGRELELLGWVARGLTNEQIARVLSIAPGTVRKHLDNVFAKLAVQTRTAAIARVFGTPPMPGGDQ